MSFLYMQTYRSLFTHYSQVYGTIASSAVAPKAFGRRYFHRYLFKSAKTEVFMNASLHGKLVTKSGLFRDCTKDVLKTLATQSVI